MSNNNYFPSAGFDGVLNNHNWSALQTFLTQATAIPKSDDSATNTILDTLKSNAKSFSENTLSKGQSLGNELYNYANTVVATVKGLQQLLNESTSQKDAIEELLSNLSGSATGSLKTANTVEGGVSQFLNSTANTANLLNARLDKTKENALEVDKQLQSASKGFAAALAGNTIDANSVQTSIQDIQAAAAKLSSISFVGLDFDTASGVSSAKAVVDDLKNLSKAWSALSKELNIVTVGVKKANQVDVGTFPGFAPNVLNSQIEEWQKIENMAHDFMLNFYVTAE